MTRARSRDERLAGLTSHEADWAGLRVVVTGLGVSGFAAADALIQHGAHVRVVDAQTPVEGTPMGQRAQILEGRDAELHCWIGTDERGQAVRSHLEASGVRLAPGADGATRTSTAQATIGEDRAATYVFDLDWNPPRPALTDGQAPLLVHTGSIALFLEPGGTAVRDTLRAAAGRALVTLDPYTAATGPPSAGAPVIVNEVPSKAICLPAT